MRASSLVFTAPCALLTLLLGAVGCDHTVEPLLGDDGAPLPQPDGPVDDEPPEDGDPTDDDDPPPDHPPPDDPPPDDPPPDDPPPDDPPPDDPPPDDPPPGGVPPTDLDCIDYQERNSRSVTGAALRDIVQHLPNGQVDYYCDPDLVTCAHEVSHGIHAELRNYYSPNSERSNAFYILQDRACFVVEPGIWKHDATPFVPAALEEFRYGTYVSGQDAWDDTPLYLWDEWNAYLNGGEAAISLYDEGDWNDGWRDQSGVIEFVAYGVAVGMAVEELDASYLASAQGTQFKAMMAYLVVRSMVLHRRFASIADFQSDTSDALYQTLRSGSGGTSIRSFLVRIYGQDWVDEVLEV